MKDAKIETTILKVVDKTYGGYDYVEYSSETNEYTTGCSRAHYGHSNYSKFSFTLKNKKELKEAIRQISLECNEIGSFSYTQYKG